MTQILTLMQTYPARIFSIVAAALVLIVHFNPDLPVDAILGLVTAVLGGGQAVHNTVTPEAHIATVDSPEQAFDILTAEPAAPEADGSAE